MEPTTNGSLAAKASYLDPTRKLHETLVENYLKELPKNASKFADAQFVSPSPARLSANMFPISKFHSLLFAVGITISLELQRSNVNQMATPGQAPYIRHRGLTSPISKPELDYMIQTPRNNLAQKTSLRIAVA